MDTQTELQTLLKSAPLTEAEAREFSDMLQRIDGKDLALIVELFKEDNAWIAWLYDNYKQKEEALRCNDKDALDHIIENEVKMLEAQN